MRNPKNSSLEHSLKNLSKLDIPRQKNKESFWNYYRAIWNSVIYLETVRAFARIYIAHHAQSWAPVVRFIGRISHALFRLRSDFNQSLLKGAFKMLKLPKSWKRKFIAWNARKVYLPRRFSCILMIDLRLIWKVAKVRNFAITLCHAKIRHKHKSFISFSPKSSLFRNLGI